MKKFQLIPILWKNLQNALQVTTTQPVLHKTEDDDENDNNDHKDEGTPPAKRMKKNPKSGSSNKLDNIKGHALSDPYKIWMHSKEIANTTTTTNNNNNNNAALPILLLEPIPTTMGAKLAELSVNGMINGLSGQLGGIVDKIGNPLSTDIKLKPIQLMGGSTATTFDEIKNIGFNIHQVVQRKLEKDVLDTTPLRIHMMLAPDLLPNEFKAVRRRVYDTVVLGKGLKVDDITDDIPVATNAQAVHDIEKVRIVYYFFIF